MKTRAKAPAKKAEANESPSNTTAKFPLKPESAHPPKLFVLPKGISTESRIVSLSNPRSSAKSRYVVCPKSGFYEFTRVAAPKSNPQSCLITLGSEKEEGDAKSKGFVSQDAELFIATRIDELFLMLQYLIPASTTKGSEKTKGMFLSGEDYLDKFVSASPQIRTLMNNGSIRARLERRMAVVCDTVEAGDETMYRLSEERLVKVMLQKAQNMVESGLPASMEDKLVRSPLEMPMSSISREESSLQENLEEGGDGGVAALQVSKSTDSQTTTVSTESASSSFSSVSTTITSVAEESVTDTADRKSNALPINAPEGVADLLRLRTASSYLSSNYLTPYLAGVVKRALSFQNSPDFSPLDSHLAHLKKLRQDAVTARSLGDFTRKRALLEDEEGIMERAEKRHKMEDEEKKKKAGTSRGVEKLKKVNVSGMKKMSDFFKKK